MKRDQLVSACLTVKGRGEDPINLRKAALQVLFSTIIEPPSNNSGDSWQQWTTMPSSSNDVCTNRPTGCDKIDQLFGGGFPSHRIIEVLGVPSSGRTSLCASTAAATAIAGQRVLYIDSSNNLTPSLLREAFMRSAMAMGELLAPFEDPATTKRFPIACSEALLAKMENLQVLKSFDIYDLLDKLASVSSTKFDLVVVDGLYSVLAPLDGGPIQGLISHLCLALKSLSATGTTVLLTNAVIPHRFPSSASGKLVPPQSILGSFMSETIDICVLLKRPAADPSSTYSLDVIRRPPYYASLPQTCSFSRSLLFSPRPLGAPLPDISI